MSARTLSNWLVPAVLLLVVMPPAVAAIPAERPLPPDSALTEVPDIEVTPSSLSQELRPDQTATQPITICNTGGLPLTWSLTEALPGSGRRGSSAAGTFLPASGGVPRGTGPASPGPTTRSGPSSGPAAVPARPAAADLSPAFAVDLWAENLVYMDPAAPAGWLIIAHLPGSVYVGGDFLDPDFGRLYVVDANLNELHTLDTTAGAVTVIGPSVPAGGESWTGLAGAPDGTLYGSATSCGSSTLYTVDPATGAATVVGSITSAPCIIDIAVTSGGEMYGVDILNDTLIQIDPATGAGTIVGPLGVNANYAQGMDHDPASGLLVWAAYTTQGELRIIDMETGTSILIGAFPGGTEVDSLAFCPPCHAEVPWLSEDPAAGTVPPDTCQRVDVTFDSSGLPAGAYTVSLRIMSNDPDEPIVLLPVSLSVHLTVYLPVVSRVHAP
jgi:hypothetical protein